eukprot:TRINITY_DN321_c2_g1_i1.p1 TRINITY_DN321_c2_g1~~TRINITY_DN321_c2_g1_i1.p1  ORF type:complete len:486 (-),score=192.53 TRINITY_DN321_c2_g1_i1:129-1586(-)
MSSPSTQTDPVVLLRLPPTLADQFRQSLKNKDRKSIQLVPNKDDIDQNGQIRNASFTIDSTTYHAKLMDLPCIIEAQKTFDKTLFFKSGDIASMFVVESASSSSSSSSSLSLSLSSSSSSSSSSYSSSSSSSSTSSSKTSYQLMSGITPPTQEIVSRVFSHTPVKPKEQMEEAESVLEKISNNEEIDELCLVEVEEEIIEEIPPQMQMMRPGPMPPSQSPYNRLPPPQSQTPLSTPISSPTTTFSTSSSSTPQFAMPRSPFVNRGDMEPSIQRFAPSLSSSSFAPSSSSTISSVIPSLNLTSAPSMSQYAPSSLSASSVSLSVSFSSAAISPSSSVSTSVSSASSLLTPSSSISTSSFASSVSVSSSISLPALPSSSQIQFSSQSVSSSPSLSSSSGAMSTSTTAPSLTPPSQPPQPSMDPVRAVTIKKLQNEIAAITQTIEENQKKYKAATNPFLKSSLMRKNTEATSQRMQKQSQLDSLLRGP